LAEENSKAIVQAMTKTAAEQQRKAKVTDENRQEAVRLRALWDSRRHESQAIFGERYGIGNQSAVSQFLRGETPLSLNAAKGFARGLGCTISDFSPRLARELTDAAQLETVELRHYRVAEALPNFSLAVNAYSVSVPVLAGGGSMGPGADVLGHEDVVVGQLSLSPSWIAKTIKSLSSPENLRFIHGYGDSMEPTFYDGDVLLVDAGVQDVKVDGIYVLSANDRLYIKRVRQRMDGSFEISSDNTTVKTVDVLDGSRPVEVLGRVVWAWNGKKL
jgi:hypothetical protein